MSVVGRSLGLWGAVETGLSLERPGEQGRHRAIRDTQMGEEPWNPISSDLNTRYISYGLDTSDKLICF